MSPAPLRCNGTALSLCAVRRFDGEFVRGVKNGRGVFRAGGNGGTYEGEFKNGLKDGVGRYCWPDGETFDGEYWHGRKEGRGLLTYPNGEKLSGVWASGELVEELKVESGAAGGMMIQARAAVEAEAAVTIQSRVRGRSARAVLMLGFAAGRQGGGGGGAAPNFLKDLDAALTSIIL